MQHTLSGFRKFVEEMDPSPDKSRDSANGDEKGGSSKKQDYFSVLGDEFGMDWKTISKIMQDEPWVSTHFDLGNLLHKLSAWEIVPGTMSPQGADIRLKKPQRGDRTYLKGNRLNKSDYEDDKRYHLNRKELQDFLTQGWTPAPGSTPMPGGPAL